MADDNPSANAVPSDPRRERNLGDTTRLEPTDIAAALTPSRRKRPVLSLIQGHEVGKTIVKASGSSDSVFDSLLSKLSESK